MTMQPDDVMIQVGEGIALSHSGNQLAARVLFAELWEKVGPDGDPFHRCAIAHAMADLQDDLREELRWDLLACEAAGQLTNARLQDGGVSGTVQVLFPSLHLNLADDYLRLEEFELASQHVKAGMRTLSFLGDDGYASMIRGGLGQVEDAVIEHRSRKTPSSN